MHARRSGGGALLRTRGKHLIALDKGRSAPIINPVSKTRRIGFKEFQGILNWKINARACSLNFVL
jgi:hypothetical protein